MKERPILFNTEMVQAVLDGRKTHTRRVLKIQSTTIEPPYLRPDGLYIHVSNAGVGVSLPFKCPYGQKGDRLWVRETHYRWGEWTRNGISKTGKQKWRFSAASSEVKYFENPPADIKKNSFRELGWYKRPSIFMPRKASRITLEITDIRVERINDISDDDIQKEGLEKSVHIINNRFDAGQFKYFFETFWDSINKKRGYGWELNSWVWVVEFKRIMGVVSNVI